MTTGYRCFDDVPSAVASAAWVVQHLRRRGCTAFAAAGGGEDGDDDDDDDGTMLVPPFYVGLEAVHQEKSCSSLSDIVHAAAEAWRGHPRVRRAEQTVWAYVVEKEAEEARQTGAAERGGHAAEVRLLDAVLDDLWAALEGPDLQQWGLCSDAVSDAVFGLAGCCAGEVRMEAVVAMLRLCADVYDPWAAEAGGGGSGGDDGGGALNRLLCAAAGSRSYEKVDALAGVFLRLHRLQGGGFVARLRRALHEELRLSRGGGGGGSSEGLLLRATQTLADDLDALEGRRPGDEAARSVSFGQHMLAGCLHDATACPGMVALGAGDGDGDGGVSLYAFAREGDDGAGKGGGDGGEVYRPCLPLSASLSGLGELFHPRARLRAPAPPAGAWSARHALHGLHPLRCVGDLRGPLRQLLASGQRRGGGSWAAERLCLSSNNEPPPPAPARRRLRVVDTPAFRRAKERLSAVWRLGLWGEVGGDEAEALVELLALCCCEGGSAGAAAFRLVSACPGVPPVLQASFVHGGFLGDDAPTPPPPPPPPQPQPQPQRRLLCVGSYNTGGGAASRAEVASVASRCDVAVFEEVYRGTLDWLAAEGVFDVVYSRSDATALGVAVACRRRSGATADAAAAAGCAASGVVLASCGGAALACVHLDARAERVRVAEVEAVVERLQAYAGGRPAVLLGDLNSLAASDYEGVGDGAARLAAVTTHRARSGWEAPAFDATGMLRGRGLVLAGGEDVTATCWAGTRVDHVWHEGARVRAAAYEVLRGEDGEGFGGWRSDHAPVWAALELAAAPTSN